MSHEGPLACYECSDGGWMAVGAIELEFRMQLLDLLGLKKDAQYSLPRSTTIHRYGSA
jgi:crotonobetainyl-CoA:carnitine CoA-transferase CaiB-like acyl-CoA transferase